MFPSTYPSYWSPVTAPNPREKYLAALAEAKAAEAEYLAAERLQQEEAALRQRLEQIQALKHQPAAPNAYYTPAHYAQPAPQFAHPTPQYTQAAPLDLDALRRQIAAEERARIVQEQQEQARELEARKAQAQRRREEALRLEEARKVQQARDAERARALATQNARLAALTQRALRPAVHFVVAEDESPRRQHCRPQHPTRPEFRNTVDLTPFLAQLQQPQAHEHNACGCAPKSTPNAVNEETNELENLFAHFFRGQQPKPKAKKAQAPAPTPAQHTISMEDVLKRVLGGAPQPLNGPEPKPKAQPQPATQTVTLEQLLGHFLGAAGIAVEQPKASTSNTPSASTSAEPSAKKEATSAPSQSESAPAPTTAPAAAPKPAAPTPAPAAQAPQPFEHILNHFLGGATSAPTSNQVDLQQLLNMFMGGRAHATAQTPAAGPSKPASSSETAKPASSSESAKPAAKEESLAVREERELAEAIRMSLAESHPAPASPTESKGKAPAPAPVKDVASSTAEVAAIDAEFTSLASEFVFPTAQLEFSTSRTPSPSRSSSASTTSETESPVARLSYSPANQPVRFYHQALSGLLARLDAVESFGDEGLRHARKEVVGRVEGALDEVERVVEGRWRKFVGREERKSEPVPAEEPVIVNAKPTNEELPVGVEAETTPEPVVESISESTSIPAPTVSESSPAAEPESPSSYPPVTDSSYPPTADSSSSYPPSIADESESVETLRPSSPAPSEPSDVDTFLLPATAPAADAVKKSRKDDEEVGSDWSEVDA